MNGTEPAEHYVVYALALQQDQRVLIGGRFSSANAVKRSNIARLSGKMHWIHPGGVITELFALSASDEIARPCLNKLPGGS